MVYPFTSLYIIVELTTLVRSIKAGIPDDTAIPLLRRFPFLQPTEQQDIEVWDTLFHSTEFGASMTREASPEKQYAVQTRQSQDGNMTATIGEATQTQPGVWDVSLLDDDFLSWPNGEFPWDQADLGGTSVLGNVLSVPSTSTSLDSGQQMIDSFANSLSPTTQWNSLGGFDMGYQEMQ